MKSKSKRKHRGKVEADDAKNSVKNTSSSGNYDQIDDQIKSTSRSRRSEQQHPQQQQKTKKDITKKDTGKSNAISIIVAIIAICVGCTIVYSSTLQTTLFNIGNSPLSSSSSSTSPSLSKNNQDKHFVLEEYDIIRNENEENWDRSDKNLQQIHDFLVNYVCLDNSSSISEAEVATVSAATAAAASYCHPLLQPSPKRRTHYIAKTETATATATTNQPTKKVKGGETVMVLPRHLLIYDLDAMRNQEFIRNELLRARHDGTNNALDSGAFLASYLLYRQKVLTKSWNWKGGDDGNDGNDRNDGNDGTPLQEEGVVRDDNTKLLQYLNILPTFDKLQTFHPVLWSNETIQDLFGLQTVSYNLIHAYKSMITSEYKAFSKSSSVFVNNIHEHEYTSMRINVMSRSFGPGPPSLEEENEAASSYSTLEEELDYYQLTSGVNLTKGCRAMSPILDLWDHHAVPNVEWMYIRDQRAFVIKVREKEILPWHDIMVSYGMYTDSHLFSKFGFVNGDGSGHTELSIATMHQLLDVGLGQQFSYMVHNHGIHDRNPKLMESDRDELRKSLLQYLLSDDGYDECITKESNPEGYELKLLKFYHLQVIANKRDRWTVTFQPRNETSKPGATSQQPIQLDPPNFNPQQVKFDGSKIINTCRLLALTNDDYNGKALEVLKSALENGSTDNFEVKRQSDELEYRALMWLARLTNVALKKYPSTVRKDMESLFTAQVPFQSKEWYALQVRLGEMQTLESLRSISSSGTRHMLEKVRKNKRTIKSAAMNIRHKLCDYKHSMKLLEEPTVYK